MANDDSDDFSLDEEQCARVKDCLSKDSISLEPERFELFVRNLEASITQFLATTPKGSFRDAHDALRDIWHLSHEDDSPLG
jgi:hypothetical protein